MTESWQQPMTEPRTSQYDRDPLDPNAEGDGGGGNVDLGNLQSPDLTVWETRPSFNLPPEAIGPTGPGPEGAREDDVQMIRIDLSSVAAEIETMLGVSRHLVAQYEELRTRVLDVQNTIFGQTATTATPSTWSMLSGQPDPNATWSEKASAWQASAQEFAAQANPMQHKALQHVGSALQVVGEYIALLNHSGQVYAEADRQSRFPDPTSLGDVV